MCEKIFSLHPKSTYSEEARSITVS